jgi:hypothetical protein
VRVFVLVDHLHRHEARAGIRQGDRHRRRVEIEDRCGVERVAVLPNDGLRIDGRYIAMMLEFTEAAFLERNGAEVEIGFGLNEGVDGHRHRSGRWRGRGRSSWPSLRHFTCVMSASFQLLSNSALSGP